MKAHIRCGTFSEEDFKRFDRMRKNTFWYQPIHHDLVFGEKDTERGKICSWSY